MSEPLDIRLPDCPECETEVAYDGSSFWCEGGCEGVWDRDGQPLTNGIVAEALGANIVEPVEVAVARGAIPHDPREYGSHEA